MTQRPDVQQQFDDLARALVGRLSPEMIRQMVAAIESGMFGVPSGAEAVRLALQTRARNAAAKIRYRHSPVLTEIIPLADTHGL